MNKNVMMGMTLVALAAILAVGVVALRGSVLELLVGKAIWYVPYVALVGGVERLLRAIRRRGANGRAFGAVFRPILGKMG